ncbi:MAG: EamA family transporter, partial [Conexibacter sp.]|nr:EamA family transporter [Conexibacter sp.]
MARVHVLLAAVCFGTTGTAQALGPGASPVTVGAARIALGALLLLLAQRIASGDHAAGWARAPLAAGALGVAGYQLCFFAAVDDTGVAVGTVVALGSAPALAGLGGWLLDQRAPGGA